MKDLQELMVAWVEKRKLISSDILFVFISMLVQYADEQDDPAEAVQHVKDLIDDEFNTKPEDRSFVYVESN